MSMFSHLRIPHRPLRKQQEFKSDRVILAVPAHVAGGLYFGETQSEKTLMNTPYASTVNLAVGMAGEWEIPASIQGVYGLLLPRRERKSIAAIAIETAKHAGRSERGHLLNIMADGKAGNRFMEWEDETIVQTLVSELDELFPRFLVNTVFHKLYRWEHAEPKSPVGRSKNISSYRKQVSPKQKVLLAGDYMGMPFSEGAAETGLWAASFIIKQVKAGYK